MENPADQSSSELRTLMVGGSSVLVDALGELIELLPEFTLAGKCGSIDEALRFCRESPPNIVVSGGNPEYYAPSELISRVHAEIDPSLPVIVVTAHPDPQVMLETFQAGAAGYLSTKMNQTALHCALMSAVQGLVLLDKDSQAILTEFLHTKADVPFGLTSREQEVLELMKSGISNKEISIELGIGIRTVEVHVAHVISKMNVKSRTQAIIEALRSGDS